MTRRLSPGVFNKAGLSIFRQCIDIIDTTGDYFAFVRCTVAIYARSESSGSYQRNAQATLTVSQGLGVRRSREGWS